MPNTSWPLFQRVKHSRPGDAPAQIVVYSEHSASLCLHLRTSPSDAAGLISVMPPHSFEVDFPILARAGLVIFTRGFERIWRSGLLDALSRIGVPCAWFTDDDITILRHEQPGFAFYSEQRVEQFAARMVALIGTTPALCERLSAFHQHVLHWPCCVNEPWLSAAAQPPSPFTRVAFVGGGFRVEGLKQFAVPALEALPHPQLAVVAGPAAAIAGARIMPFEPDFERFLALWRAVGVDILVHPPGQTRNLAGKGPGILLCALYLGAVPVVADEPAFQGLGAEQGVLRAGSAAAWRAALAQLAEPAERNIYWARLRAYANQAWPPGGGEPAMNALLAYAAPGGEAALVREQAAQALRWRPPAHFTWREQLQRFASPGR